MAWHTRCVANRLARGIGFVAMAAAAVGCDRQPNAAALVEIRGRVTRGGEPLHVAKRDLGLGVVRIAFHRVVDGRTSLAEVAATAADDQGYFRLPDPIPAGEYRVVVEQWDPYPNVDRLGGKFDARRTPLLRNVSEQEGYLEIDVEKP